MNVIKEKLNPPGGSIALSVRRDAGMWVVFFFFTFCIVLIFYKDLYINKIHVI